MSGFLAREMGVLRRNDLQTELLRRVFAARNLFTPRGQDAAGQLPGRLWRHGRQCRWAQGASGSGGERQAMRTLIA